LRRERLSVVRAEPVGPYTLLRVRRGGIDPGRPGQFFMLEAPGRLLPRPMSLCLAPPGELAFLIDPIGPGTRALCALDRGDAIGVLGPLGNGFELDVERPLLVGGGIGVAPLPYLSDALGRPRAVLGFRSFHHAEAAALVPRAEVVVEPRLVTELLEPGCAVLACGPEPMLEAVRRLAPAAQLAWEAPMACGYGACYGCAVEIDGAWKRLCVEGPVLVSLSRGPGGKGGKRVASRTVQSRTDKRHPRSILPPAGSGDGGGGLRPPEPAPAREARCGS
jgi:dihydroorotate dehydrogenase electron transfer subunit